jgi:hypothetical protein
MRIETTWSRLLAMAVTLWIPAAAGAAATGANLYAAANGSFDRDIVGWTEASFGTVSHDPQQGALAGSGPDSSLSVPGPCVEAAPDTAYAASVRIRLVSGTTYVCGFSVFQFSDTACTEGSEPLFAEAALIETEWQTVTASGASTTAARGLRIVLNCSGEKDFAVRFDDVSLSAR